LKKVFIYCVLIVLWFFSCEVFAQKTDNKSTKKPVLTNKYRLKKRAKPVEGTQSKGAEKVTNEKTVSAGFFRGKQKYTQAPKVMGQSTFKGSEPFYPREKTTGVVSTFKSQNKISPHKFKTGVSEFKSTTKYKPHKLKTGSSKFLSQTKHKPHQFRRGYDKFVSSYAYMPYKKKTGYDKFVSNYKFLPHKKKTGFATFMSKTKYRPHEFRRGYDKFTGGTIKYNFLEKRRKTIAYNTRKQQNYKGSVRYIDWKKIRAKRSHRMATSLGALKIKYYPRKSKLTNRSLRKYTKKPYDVRHLRVGKFMWKKNMPRYQRFKTKKPRYNPTEKQGAVMKNGLPVNAVPRVSPKFVKNKQKEKNKIQQEPKQD
jgi:hypothetical protein